jgi:hypothetical protein
MTAGRTGIFRPHLSTHSPGNLRKPLNVTFPLAILSGWCRVVIMHEFRTLCESVAGFADPAQ